MSRAKGIVNWLAAWLAGGGSLLVLTDYDGTLTPIVPDPAEAWLRAEVRGHLQMLAEGPRSRLAVISGRDLSDVRGRVAVPQATYAGCHGLDIEGPDLRFSHPEAEAQRDTLRALAQALERRAPSIPGMRIEPKRLSVAIHYRHVASEQIRRVEVELARAMQHEGLRLRIFHGIKVLEVLPQVSWGKAECAVCIRDALQRPLPQPVMALCMGDEWTDERAFEALPGQAITVRVGADVAASRADYRFDGVEEVHEMLAALASELTRGSPS